MNPELAWFLLPVAAMLSQIGGTWWKPARRFGIPIVLSLTLILFKIVSYKAILCGISVLIAAVLPITLISSDIRAHWFNWIWPWILGYIMGVGSAIIHPAGFLLALVPAGVVGSFTMFSNIQTTARFFPWKMCEAIFWISAMYPFIFLI